jgi:hypothetical protein
MSLNWQASDNTSESLLTYKTRFKGKEDESQHPVLHRLIFLTMTLKADLDGNEKHKADVKKRVAYINLTNSDLTTLTFGEEADKVEVWDGEKWVGFVEHFKPKKRFDQDGSISGWQVVINDKWVDKYWGLSTNADRETFSKWFKSFNESTLRIMERNGY